jgi:hypothetical protein
MITDWCTDQDGPSLVKANSVQDNQLLSSQGTDQQLLVTLRSQVYLVM